MNNASWYVLGALVASLIVSPIAYMTGTGQIKREAYERGHMVECLGETGYRWECEDTP